ncbi:MAG: hypothetical protein LW717_00775 [Chloroflexaceae bacterium]|nr:hypothetical protein [Chloroflexaceae bacterium]
MKRRRLLQQLLLMPLVACTNTQPSTGPTPGPQAGIFVDAGYRYQPIPTLVYGTNTGPWQTIGFEQRQIAQDTKIAMIRWPGGNWGDENDVTPLMVDEYMQLCTQIGATPSIHVRLFGGTAEKAAELVRYTNITKQYAVRYWAVGNEPDLFVKNRGASQYGIAEYVRDFIAFRAAMKAVDPTIVVMGPELSQFGPNESYPRDATGEYWLRGFLKAVPDVEMVSLHRYPFGERAVTRDMLAADPPSWTESIAFVRQLMRDTIGKEIPLAITEANSDWSGRVDDVAGTNSWANALWWAEVLARLIAADCQIVNQFCMGAIQSQGIGLFGPVSYNSGPLPTFEVYRLMQKLGGIRLHASIDDARAHVLAAQRDDGILTLLFVNQQSQARTLPITLANAQPRGLARVWRFSDANPVAQSDDIDITLPVQWPAYSATLLEIPI